MSFRFYNKRVGSSWIKTLQYLDEGSWFDVPEVFEGHL